MTVVFVLLVVAFATLLASAVVGWTTTPDEDQRFVAAKLLVSLVLLVAALGCFATGVVLYGVSR